MRTSEARTKTGDDNEDRGMGVVESELQRAALVCTNGRKLSKAEGSVWKTGQGFQVGLRRWEGGGRGGE